MFKLVSFFAAAVAVAAPALADTPIQFENNGIAYVGTISDRDGVRYISGHEVGSNRTFRLRVAHGRVTGDYAGDEVAYAEPVRLVTAH